MQQGPDGKTGYIFICHHCGVCHRGVFGDSHWIEPSLIVILFDADVQCACCLSVFTWDGRLRFSAHSYSNPDRGPPTPAMTSTAAVTTAVTSTAAVPSTAALTTAVTATAAVTVIAAVELSSLS